MNLESGGSRCRFNLGLIEELRTATSQPDGSIVHLEFAIVAAPSFFQN